MHLHEDSLLHRRCVVCPSQAPSCSCGGLDQECVITSQSCDACATASCVSTNSVSSGSGGVSSGAIAGAVVGVVILLGASVGLFIWYRRRQRAAKTGAQPVTEPKSDVPARAEAVLSRPDPVEKPPSISPHEPESVRMYSVMSNSTINLDPQANSGADTSQNSRGSSHRGSLQSNPFTDTHSIQTTSASTQSTNVIPIALVPHGSVSSPPHSPGADNRSGSPTSAPSRPARTPDLGLRFDPLSSSLNLEHVNVSKDSFRPPNALYAQSQASGLTGFSSRDSVMTSGSFASDVLYEAPQIVTNAGRVNLLKAEVVSVGTGAPTGGPDSGAQTLKPPSASRISKPSARSPLAQSSFGPTDALSVSESEEGQEVEYRPQRSPFGDEHSPRLRSGDTSTTFGGNTPIPIPSTASPDDQYHPNSRFGDENDGTTNNDSPVSGRPISSLTQATSIIGAEIGGATVVRLNSTGSADRRLTSARLVTPTSGPLRSHDDRTLQQQQAQALEAARARAAASGLPMPGMSSRGGGSGPGSQSQMSPSSSSSSSAASSIHNGNMSPHVRRVSEASVMTQMSVGADSLLESFTFVPPSPISNRPARSPTSPLAQQAMSSAAATASAAAAAGVPPVPPLPRLRESQNGGGKKEDMNMGNRQVAGMSTLSNASTGIEGYDFRLDDGQEREQTRASVTSDTTFGPRTVKSSLNTDTNTGSTNGSADTSAKTQSRPPPPSAAIKNNLNADGSIGSKTQTDKTDKTQQTIKGRQRASLDTLALTSDLSAFPLNFDEGRSGGYGVSK